MKTDLRETLSEKNSAGAKKYFSADMTDSKKYLDAEMIDNKKDSDAEATDYKKDISTEMTDDERIDFVAAQILELYRPAFEELAK